MLKRLAVGVLLLCMFSLYSQDTASENNDKYTVVNLMITQVIQCSEGLVVKYRSNNQPKVAYIPNKFFRSKIAIKIDENDTNVSPQMNVILKNMKPYRVKLYLAPNASNLTYRIMDVMTDDMRQKFNMDDLQIEF